jgi:hypothetical protein
MLTYQGSGRSRLEARLNDLKAENAKLRGFAECVASQSLDTADGSWILKDLVDEALGLLAEIDVATAAAVTRRALTGR